MSQSQDFSNNPSGHEKFNTDASVDQEHNSDVLGNYSGPVQRCLRNFILGKKIGAGTFSKVCIAKHKLTNEQVAIKIIEKAKIQNEADRIRLDRQMKIMRKVRHPNIAQLYQIIQTAKYIYLVMEYAARGQLFDHIVSHEKLNEFEASKFLLQLVDAIEYLHTMGIAHRDLKPQNLLLDYKYNIKVTDFGLSNIYATGKMLTTACGSPSYACPEMLSSYPYDGLKADIWSIGIVLYAMCFGYLPFDNQNISELYKLIKKGQFELPQFASESLGDILRRILQVDPKKRASIAEIRNHSFCKFSVPSTNLATSIPGIIVGLSDIPYETLIQNQMRNELNINVEHLREQVKKNKHNENTCTYYLLLQRWLRSKSQSLTNYYVKNYNIINRYSLIQRVKANIDKQQRNRMEIKKFQAVQEQMKAKNKGNQESSKKQMKTALKANKSHNASKKIVHSAQAQTKIVHILKESNTQQQDQNYLKSHLKHFAPNNTKKHADKKQIKQKRNESKSKSKSKSKSPSKSNSNSKNRSKSKSKSMSQGKNNTKKKLYKNEKKNRIKESKYVLEVPREFLSSNKRQHRESKTNKGSWEKKERKSSSTKKKRSKTLEKEEVKKKRNKSLPRGIKLKF